jgi:hypothetical protein
VSEWLIIIALAPFIALLLVGGWFAASVFVIWIAGLALATLFAGAIVLTFCAICDYVRSFIKWLKG